MFKKKICMFGSCFLKLFLRTVFENIKNTNFVFSEKLFLSSVFSLFFNNKKKNENQTCSSYISYSSCFLEYKTILKNMNQTIPYLLTFDRENFEFGEFQGQTK